MSDNGERLEFDFSELSWGDSQDFAVLQAQVNAASSNPNADPIELRAIFERMNAYLAIMVVNVPRSMLVKRAPAELDFSKAESFRYLRQSSLVDLMNAMSEAQANQKK
jgi:hypothetical protein